MHFKKFKWQVKNFKWNTLYARTTFRWLYTHLGASLPTVYVCTYYVQVYFSMYSRGQCKIPPLDPCTRAGEFRAHSNFFLGDEVDSWFFVSEFGPKETGGIFYMTKTVPIWYLYKFHKFCNVRHPLKKQQKKTQNY